MLIFRCGHCLHEGRRAGNGFSTWCAWCNCNNRLELIEDTEITRRTVNGNLHLVNMEVREYYGLKFVLEHPEDGAVRLTVYRERDPNPISTETYGNE